MTSWPYFPYVFAILLAIPFMVLLRQFFYKMIELKTQELKLLATKSGSDQKAQALERMTLFLERIKPANLVKRFGDGLKAHEFIFLSEKAIQEEFDFNSSQQVYISKNNWQQIINSKNRMVQQLHETYEKLKGEATLEDYKTIFLMSYMEGDDYIAENMAELKKEMLIVT